MVISGIRTYVMHIASFQCEFHHDTGFVIRVTKYGNFWNQDICHAYCIKFQHEFIVICIWDQVTNMVISGIGYIYMHIAIKF